MTKLKDHKFGAQLLAKITALVLPSEVIMEQLNAHVAKQIGASALVALTTGEAPPKITIEILMKDGLLSGIQCELDVKTLDALGEFTMEELMAKTAPHVISEYEKEAKAEQMGGFFESLMAGLGNTEDKDLKDAVEDAETGFASEGNPAQDAPATPEPEANTTAAPQEAPAEDKAA